MSIYKKMVKGFGVLFFILGFLLNKGTEVSAQEKVYIIGTDTTYAPFEYVDEEGDFVGIDMDLLEAIAEDQGFEYELRILGFNAAEIGRAHV